MIMSVLFPGEGLTMGISKQILADLPALRRFARAISGSQAIGDAHVESVLQSLLAHPEHIDKTSEIRLVLYRHVLKRAASEGASEAAGSGDSLLQRRLWDMAPDHRVAFLLRSLEGLSPEAIARVMECSVQKVEELLVRGAEEISHQLVTDVLIIEDEPFIALDLETLVTDMGHHVIDVARTHKEALAIIRNHKPGLILSDIRLADGSSGLEAVNELLQDTSVPVIFITAYPERFLTGDKPEPAFLVTKPYLPETIKALINQALFFERRAHAARSDAASARGQAVEQARTP
jgi:CheY-like chemotaxis protein/DNA-directed RNA polymerase specialized sigma24 family protein